MEKGSILQLINVSVHLHSSFKSEIEFIAQGGSFPNDSPIVIERNVWRNMSLCSDPAEGFHRGMNLEKNRASCGTLPFRFGSIRLPQNLEIGKRFCATPEGAKTFSYNWVNYSRILQIKKRGFLWSKKASLQVHIPSHYIFFGK